MATRALCGGRRSSNVECALIASNGSNGSNFVPLSTYQKRKSVICKDRSLMCMAPRRGALAIRAVMGEKSATPILFSFNLAETARTKSPLQSSPSRATSIGLERRSSRDPRRLAAFAAALVAIGELSYTWFSEQTALPTFEDIMAGPLPTALTLLLAGFPAGLLAAKVALGDFFHVELHRGRLYICTGVPSAGPPLAAADAVDVRPTGDIRGNGAYAVSHISSGTHIGDYTGELLDRAAFTDRYPDNQADFAMAIDDEWVIDAAAIAPCTTSFHTVHMNHSRTRANVRRYYKRREGRISFFAIRDIEPGEELLYDYGRAYWYGREHLELP
ncbi:hypothetical protein Vretimale_1553 [Volvox reticuliferus]|uniref:SET domain-containing protein n=2 Tax=Volvox reticuliferus TaxID=1737510 RepID=A0A8J4FZH2_9CHLO|nr:hypothetical protein Vretimale_1553 [Volvox reticuliferus]